MAEEIWRPGLLIGNPDGLQFALTLSFADKLGLAWGEGMVFLAGESVWFAEGPEGQEIPLSWTWADLLAFLGRWWPWLVLEEDYPLPLQPLYPAFFHTRIRPWFEVRNALEEVGETIAAAVLTSSNPRARQALELWKQREKNLTEKELYLTTGLSSDARNRLPGIDWRSAEIRAVARMSSGAVVAADQEELLTRIAAVPRRETPELDRLSALIRAEFLETGPPHQQGYWAAARLRQELGTNEQKVIEPREYLEQWGVLIEVFERESCPVEAVTAWGERHGPVIIINHAASSRAGHEYGQRATLAHELAHLILDREGAMPAGEVLGGRTPEYPEKRARAFAAEFLLPRKTAEAAVRCHASLEEAAQYLQKTYRVSTELLAWQINNSCARMLLSDEERTRLELWKTGRTVLPEFPGREVGGSNRQWVDPIGSCLGFGNLGG
ncbi:MAG: ImmA/IrrE family metallo-endopeptidase [Deltaproteobacteria bacterium]|jgi:Zn-dependent peptidase ImmA (M78 family)